MADMLTRVPQQQNTCVSCRSRQGAPERSSTAVLGSVSDVRNSRLAGWQPEQSLSGDLADGGAGWRGAEPERGSSRWRCRVEGAEPDAELRRILGWCESEPSLRPHH